MSESFDTAAPVMVLCRSQNVISFVAKTAQDAEKALKFLMGRRAKPAVDTHLFPAIVVVSLTEDGFDGYSIVPISSVEAFLK